MHGGEFRKVDKNSDKFSNFANFSVSGHFRLEPDQRKGFQRNRQVTRTITATRHRGQQTKQMLSRARSPTFTKVQEGCYRFDPAKIDWENFEKVVASPLTLKTRNPDR